MALDATLPHYIDLQLVPLTIDQTARGRARHCSRCVALPVLLCFHRRLLHVFYRCLATMFVDAFDENWSVSLFAPQAAALAVCVSPLPKENEVVEWVLSCVSSH